MGLLGKRAEHVLAADSDPAQVGCHTRANPVEGAGLIAGIGSVLLLPELLTKLIRENSTDELDELGSLLGRLDLRPVDQATAELATALAASYGLRALVGEVNDQIMGQSAQPFITHSAAEPTEDPHTNVNPNGVFSPVASEQIAVRLPEELLVELDDLVSRGVYVSRAAAVRAGVEAITESDRRRNTERAVLEGYRRIPPTKLEDQAAVASLRDAIAEEPW